MEICNSCPCNCRPISQECVTRYSDIKDPTILQDSHYQKATDDIDNLIGVECSEELCAALVQAVKDLNDSGDDNKTIADFLAEKWLNIIENRHFKKWYSNRLMWHWVFGASISELSASGLVTLSNDDDVKNSFAQATEDERQRLQDSANFYAIDARKKFLDYYWNKNKSKYDCIESDCCIKKTENCHDVYPKKNGGIGMTVI